MAAVWLIGADVGLYLTADEIPAARRLGRRELTLAARALDDRREMIGPAGALRAARVEPDAATEAATRRGQPTDTAASAARRDRNGGPRRRMDRRTRLPGQRSRKWPRGLRRLSRRTPAITRRTGRNSP